MADNFYYNIDPNKVSDLVGLSALCETSMVNYAYGYTMVDRCGAILNELGYCPETTFLVAYSTSTLRGLWANRRASYCDSYLVNGEPVSIAARGCAPIPIRNKVGSHIEYKDIEASCRLLYLNADDANATSGSGIYRVLANSYTFITDKTHIVLDIVGGGGGGSGGNKGTNAGGHSRAGSGGGSGAWASYLIDMTKHGDFSITIGEPGQGGACEGDGTSGGSSYISINTACSGGIIDNLNGGTGAKGSNYWDGVGDAGTGGGKQAGVYTAAELANYYGVYRLASGTGASGGKGGSVNNSHAAGNQGSHGPEQVAFGDLAIFNNSDYYGGTAAQNPSYNYSSLDTRYAIGGGGGGSLFALGGAGEGAMKGSTIYVGTEGFGTKGSGGGGGYGGAIDDTSKHKGAKGGRGHARIYFEAGVNSGKQEIIQAGEYVVRDDWAVADASLPVTGNMPFYSSVNGSWEEFDQIYICIDSDMLIIRYRYYFADETQTKEYEYPYTDGYNYDDDSLTLIEVQADTEVSSRFYTIFNQMFAPKGSSSGGSSGGNASDGPSGPGNEEIPFQ